MARKIIVMAYTDVYKEFEANAALYPGHLVEEMSTGKLRKHATAGGNVAPVMVAIEDALQGKAASEAYAEDDIVRVFYPRPGDEGYLILADGETIVIGDLLESNGDGTVRKHVVDSTGAYYLRQIVAKAKEAVDTSGSPAGETDFILVEFI